MDTVERAVQLVEVALATAARPPCTIRASLMRADCSDAVVREYTTAALLANEDRTRAWVAAQVRATPDAIAAELARGGALADALTLAVRTTRADVVCALVRVWTHAPASTSAAAVQLAAHELLRALVSPAAERLRGGAELRDALADTTNLELPGAAEFVHETVAMRARFMGGLAQCAGD